MRRYRSKLPALGEGLRTALLVCAAYFLLCAALNGARGAMASHFGAHQDEPSHVVTGLMVRDYLTHPEPRNPLEFAKQYYLHYPKVALGQWPPVFYLVQALWTLPFGTSRVSLVLLMSLIGALTATAIFMVSRREVGPAAAGLAGTLFLLLPLVQNYGSRVLTEVPLALIMLLATLQFGRYMRTERVRDAVGFALLAALGIMTKGTALCLALVPFFALLITGRWRLLRRGGLWLSALIVALLCGPWYWFALGITRTTWGQGSSVSLANILAVLPGYAQGCLSLGGTVLAALALCGLAATLSRRESRARWAAPMALIPSLVCLVAVIPVGADARHLIPIAPIWIIACALGAKWVAERVSLVSPMRVGVVMAGAMAWFGVQAFEFPSKHNEGFQEAVADLMADESLDDAVFLIVSDAIGEGAFVSEVALHDQRPGHIVLRGSKVLSRSSWTGMNYRSFFANTTELSFYLRSIPVGVLVFDHSAVEKEWFEHQDLVLELVENGPRAWQPIGTFDVVRNGERQAGALRLYRQVGFERLARKELEPAAALGDRTIPGLDVRSGPLAARPTPDPEP